MQIRVEKTALCTKNYLQKTADRLT